MRYLALSLLLALTGCSSGIPAHVQPEEYEVYHAFLADYVARNPAEITQLYTFDGVTGSAFGIGESQPRERKYRQCVSQQADKAFLKIGDKLYWLDKTDQSWRTLPDVRVIPVIDGDVRLPNPHTSIGFSRVFFDPSKKDAYFRATVDWCSRLAVGDTRFGCGGYSVVWHAVRTQNNWTFNATGCGGVS